MANMSPSRVGSNNGGGDAKELFLKVFAGEVLTAFAENNVFDTRHMTRTIPFGKTAQFPVSGKGTASYHTPGTQLTGSSVLHSERTISIDDVLIADRFIASIDEAMNHYEFRSIYSRDIGMALARQYDRDLAQIGVLAARASATVTGGNGGTVLTDADAATNGDSLVASIFDAVQAFAEKDVPMTDRYVFVRPDQYFELVNSAKIVNRDYSTNNGGVDSGVVIRVAGVPVLWTNNLRATNVATGPAAYQGDFSTTVALVMQKEATGTVKLQDIKLESEYLIEYQGTLMLGKYAVGHGILRPDCAVEIKTA